MDRNAEGPGVLRKVESVAETVIGIIVGFTLAGMVILVFMNVVFRYFLNSAIAWSEEIARFMLIWLSFLGAVLAFMKNDHLSLDILVKALPRRPAAVLSSFADILVLIAVGLIFSGGLWIAQDSFSSGWTSPATETPYGIVYLVVPVSAGLMFLLGLLKLVRDLRAVAAAKGAA